LLTVLAPHSMQAVMATAG